MIEQGGGRIEYAGSDMRGLFAQPTNILRPRFWSMLTGIRKFYQNAERHADVPAAPRSQWIGAEAEPQHGGGDGAVAGDHGHHGPVGGGDFLDAAQRFETVDAWHHDVHQHELRRVGDGHRIDERVEMLLSSDSDVAVCKSMGLALISFAEVFGRLDPHIVLGLGDRYELFAALSAASVSTPRA